MAIPEKLYKYCGASLQDITNLSSAKIWFSDPSGFNDPFDCPTDIIMPVLSRAKCILVLQRLYDGKFPEAAIANKTDDKLRNEVVGALKTVILTGLAGKGVTCFSAVPDNMLMWGHYGHSHQGFCLEFVTAGESLFDKVRPVKYAIDFPRLSAEALIAFDFEEILNTMMLSKAKYWEYEQEWRVIHKEMKTIFGYERTSLSAVYIGAKMSEEHFQMIGALLARTDTKIYRMHLSDSSFKLVPELLTFVPIDYRKAAKKVAKPSARKRKIARAPAKKEPTPKYKAKKGARP
jgi:hypothetical protein